jgi:hypothetical protein
MKSIVVKKRTKSTRTETGTFGILKDPDAALNIRNRETWKDMEYDR